MNQTSWNPNARERVVRHITCDAWMVMAGVALRIGLLALLVVTVFSELAYGRGSEGDSITHVYRNYPDKTSNSDEINLAPYRARISDGKLASDGRARYAGLSASRRINASLLSHSGLYPSNYYGWFEYPIVSCNQCFSDVTIVEDSVQALLAVLAGEPGMTPRSSVNSISEYRFSARGPLSLSHPSTLSLDRAGAAASIHNDDIDSVEDSIRTRALAPI